MARTHGGRSRVYDLSSADRVRTTVSGGPPEQGDFMRAEPYLASDPDRDDVLSGGAAGGSPSQRGQHGEGAETTGNSARGALSAGLSGATTTRGGQQGGIGASAHDPEPAAADGDWVGDPGDAPERDLTLGEQFGGTMAREA